MIVKSNKVNHVLNLQKSGSISVLQTRPTHFRFDPKNSLSEVLSRALFFLAVIVLVVCVGANQVKFQDKRDKFFEDLYIKPLDDGKLLAHFQFTILYRKNIKNIRWENKIELFPLSLVDLIATTDLKELHFSLTKGNWNYKNWGYPVRSSPPGAQIRAKFSKHNEQPSRSWQRLVNSLAGKFCTSLVSADKKTLVDTRLSFENSMQRQASVNSTSETPPIMSARKHEASSERLLYSNLPEETLCTENLTPWKKLLPCYSQSGLASLLNAVNLFKSSHSSLSIDLVSKQCLDEEGDIVVDCEQVQLTQSISVVFNTLSQFEGKQSWSITKIFGSSIQRLCPLAAHSRIYVDISTLDYKDKLYPQNYKEYFMHLSDNEVRRYATYELNSIINIHDKEKDSTSLNMGVKKNQIFKRIAYSTRPKIPVHLKTHIAGLGSADGTFVATVTNMLNVSIRVIYMDVVPYFMRIYLHTLTIRTSSGHEIKPDKFNYILSQDETPTLIEFSFVLSPNSETQISYDFDRAFLTWTDFRPDANKGVLLGSAMISIPIQSVLHHLVMPLCLASGRLEVQFENNTMSDKNAFLQLSELEDEHLRIYSKPLLIILPTPDFSMPYNVLCLVTTVLISAFGPLYNMTTRKPVIRFNKQSKKLSISKEFNSSNMCD